MPAIDVFPALHSCTQLLRDGPLYDVKFYPYTTVDDDQIFAVAGDRDVYICRPKLDVDPPFELLRWFKDKDLAASFNSLAWVKDSISRQPLLCLAGRTPKQIKVLDIQSGEPVRTLPGHGKGINDLAVHPISTDLIASAAEDYTIRLWNLHPKFQKQPCVAMFAGEGHKQPILAVHFHPNGQWMLSGGLDTAVCLWAVPRLEELDKTETEINGGNEPKAIYYPHFHSTEVHHNYVDCVQFYGDLIISRAAKDQNDKNKNNQVLLWKIDGFNPNEAPPTDPPIPAPDVNTRSSFPHGASSRGFQRLLSFDIFNTDRFYHRFGLLHSPGMRPILCMGNQESKLFFWDLQRLEEGWEPGEEKKPRKGKGGRKAKGGVSAENLNRLEDLRRGESAGSGASNDGTGSATPMPSSTSHSAPPDRKLALSDPFLPLKPHTTIIPQTSLPKDVKSNQHRHFATSQLAWSPDGTWLVSVGDYGMMCIFHRDKSVVNGVPKAGDGSNAKV